VDHTTEFIVPSFRDTALLPMKISEPTDNKWANAKIEGNEDETVLVRLFPTEDFMLRLRMGNLLVSTLTWFPGEYAFAAD
jgi:hypothetical protein